MLKACIQKLIQGGDLTEQEAAACADEIMAGASDEQIAAFLVLLRAKGETGAELYGIAKVLRACMKQVLVTGKVMDIVGSGGDGAHTFNVSTGAAILAASCGVKLCKHGNRSISSSCGSANVLEALGVPIDLSDVAACVESIGIGFCLAPRFHPSWVAVKPVRSALAVPTCFNVLGTVLNPAKAQVMMVGLYSPEFLRSIAEVLVAFGVERAFVYHSQGLDELTPIGSAEVIEIQQGRLRAFTLTPSDYGFEACALSDLQGGDVATNKRILWQALQGEAGPVLDTLLLNAGVAVYLYGLTGSIEDGITKARAAVAAGKPLQLLERWSAYA